MSFVSLIKAFLGKNRKEMVDQRLMGWSNFLLKQAKITYAVHRQQKIELKKEKAYIIMCNHSSLYDIPSPVAP